MSSSPVDQELAREMAQLFAALGDPTRVRIISALLEEEVRVSDLARMVGLSKSAVSHQLSTLRQMRLVRRRKAGREAYYTLDDEHVADLYRRSLDHVQHP